MKCYAKINLTLDIVSRREDGFHNIQSIMQKIDIYDVLTIKKSSEIIIDSPIKDDIVRRAVEKLKGLFDIDEGVRILLKKGIPIEAGLGGGSSDAASTLLALNKLWDLNLSRADLTKIALELGSDVPFFLYGNCARVSGKGDIVRELDAKEMHLLLINPGYKLSTAEMYKKFDRCYKKSEDSTKKLYNDLSNLDYIHNAFLSVQGKDVKNIIAKLRSIGAIASITGKGPTVFGIFKNKGEAVSAKKEFDYPFVKVTKTLS